MIAKAYINPYLLLYSDRSNLARQPILTHRMQTYQGSADSIGRAVSVARWSLNGVCLYPGPTWRPTPGRFATLASPRCHRRKLTGRVPSTYCQSQLAAASSRQSLVSWKPLFLCASSSD